jgi:predicted amidohydrolase
MKKIKLSTISMKTTAMDFQGNLEKILDCIENEKCVSSDLILFPSKPLNSNLLFNEFIILFFHSSKLLCSITTKFE